MKAIISRFLSLFRFNAQSFQSRIAISILLAGIVMIIFAYLLIGRMVQITKRNEAIASTYQPVKMYAFACFQAVNQMISILQNSVYVPEQRISSRTNEEILDLWEKKALAYNDSLRRVVLKRSDEPELAVTYEAIGDRMNKMDKLVKEAIAINRKGQRSPVYYSDRVDLSDTTTIKANKAVTFYDDALAFLLANEITRLQKELDVYFSQLISFNDKATEKLFVDIQEENQFFTLFQVIVFLVTAVALIALIFLLNSHIGKNLEKIDVYTEELAEGNLPETLHTQVAELDPIAEHLNILTKNLQNLRKYAISVKEGKFDAELNVFGGKGTFGEAITQMREGLLKVSEEERIRTWRNTGIAKFSEILRRESSNLDKLSEELIGELVKYVGANQGGIFIVNEENPNEPYLELVAAYAYNKKKFLEKKVLKGQGLVGRAWLEGLPIYLSEVPNDYIEIRTGLGGANPRYIFIVPLKINEKVEGVIELASFHPFKEFEQDFIKQIADSVASTFSSTKVNRRTQQLLEESQRITALMREKEEELRQNIEELQATQEEMQRNQRELAEKEGNMRALLDNASDAIMAFNHKRQITVINKAMKNLYESIGVYLDVGRVVDDAFPGRTYEQMQEEIKRVLAGERFKTSATVTIRGITYYYDILYNPIYNERQRVVGASVFITDVTQQRTAELELKMKEANLQSLINNTEDSIMAIDKNYNLLVFNEVFRKRRKEYNFKEGDNVFTTIPEHLHEEWKKYYDRALAGERFEKVIKRDLGNKKIQYREHSFNPIFNEKGEVIGVSVFAKDITEAKLAEAENQRIMATLFEKQKQDKKRIEELERQLKELQEMLETKTT
ncbi:MAG: PAS domain-containing protein [Raineya sp.]|nr:PAS domain-containing protein [Raineya sp.]